MGIRCYQEVGLRSDARAFLDENANRVPGMSCPKCGEVISWKMDSICYETKESFYDDGPALQEYNLKDGRKVKEVVQAEPWSSGPMAFFCLEFEDGTRMFEWTEEEIDDATR